MPYSPDALPATVDVDAEPDSQELARSALHAIVNGRKSWKTIRGRSEAVWPPYLEGALIEGLQKYRQTEGLRVSALGGGRFPMRNRFISEHIFNTTGKRRTPKQVGSRLQQLRDTRGGKQVLKLLSDRTPPTPPANATRSSTEPDNKAYTPDAPFETTVVNIPILRPSASGYSTPTNYSNSATQSPPSSPDAHLSPGTPLSPSSPSPSSFMSPLSVGPARPIRQIDNTLTFVSHCPLPGPDVAGDSPYYISEFAVTGSQGEVHRESTQMHLSKKVPSSGEGDATAKEKYLYSTMLVPTFWERLCQSSDPTQYTIKQEIVKTERKASPSPSPASTSDLRLPSRSPSVEPSTREGSSTPEDSGKVVVLAMRYQFVYHSPSDIGLDSGLWSADIGARLTVPGDDRRPSTSSSASSYLSEEVEQNFAFGFGMDVDSAGSGSGALQYDTAALSHILSSQNDMMQLSQEGNSLLPPLMLDAKPELPSWSAPVTPVDPFSSPADVVFGANQAALHAFSGTGSHHGGAGAYQFGGGEWEGPGGGYHYPFAEAQIQMSLSVQEDVGLKGSLSGGEFAFMDALKVPSPPMVNYPSPPELERMLGSRR